MFLEAAIMPGLIRSQVLMNFGIRSCFPRLNGFLKRNANYMAAQEYTRRCMAQSLPVHSRSRIARLMRENSLVARKKRRFKVTTDSSHDYPISPNLVDRNFMVGSIDTCWLSDITYIDTYEGWLYLCSILDLGSKKVVGWSMASHMRAELAIDALDMAVAHRNPGTGLIFHSDRGIQYASGAFREKLKQYRMVQSMSRKGDCWDNAPIESFFSTLKMEEVFIHKKYQTKEGARKSIFEYIEVFYNRQRSHSSLDYVSPVEYEELMLRKVA